ncbi:hypothetical protein HDU88_004287 [Geranomyces variabilis]|nr:hypothetical protein HDU88_004287 [Geranomyces variabilis]
MHPHVDQEFISSIKEAQAIDTRITRLRNKLSSPEADDNVDLQHFSEEEGLLLELNDYEKTRMGDT